MATQACYPHIEKRDGEPARLQRVPRVRVAMIVMDYLYHAWSVDEMCRQHPYLTPAEAHAAMLYYFDHQEEIESEIRTEEEQDSQSRTNAPPSAFKVRLQAKG